jgi:hypothetical protein
MTMKTIHFILMCCVSNAIYAQTGNLLPNYNPTFYTTVLQAAQEVAKPFLLQQKRVIMPGVSVHDSTLVYNGSNYVVHNAYQNPSTSTNYYVLRADYSNYGITGFQTLWPTRIPNILYKTADNSFNNVSDCVGYATRVLSCVGGTTTSNNAYFNLIQTVKARNVSPFATYGWVCTAYQLSVAIPTMPISGAGWKYISGNVQTSLIDSYNHVLNPSVSTYTGVRKGGFGNAQAGDLLAFGYAASASSNGHAMFLKSAPTLLTADSVKNYMPTKTIANIQSLLTQYNVYAVLIWDCTSQNHFRDSRQTSSGIGESTILILTSKTDNAPLGYIWSNSSGSTISPTLLGTTVLSISVGRYNNSTLAPTPTTILNAPLKVSLFPNPAEDQLLVVTADPINIEKEIRIYNSLGICVLRTTSFDVQTEINIASLSKGAYWLEMTASNNRQSVSFVKR